MYVLYRALAFILQHTVAVMLSIDFVIYTCIEMLKVQPPSHLREMDWTHAHKGQVAVQIPPESRWNQSLGCKTYQKVTTDNTPPSPPPKLSVTIIHKISLPSYQRITFTVQIMVFRGPPVLGTIGMQYTPSQQTAAMGESLRAPVRNDKVVNDSRRSLSCCFLFLLIISLGCLRFLVILGHGGKHLGKAPLLSFSEGLLFVLGLC